MELLACFVPLYAMHRIMPFACATCLAVGCYVLARRVALKPPHAGLSSAVNKFIRASRPKTSNESFSPPELCPVAAMYHNAEPQMLLLTPELHSEIAAVVDSILQAFILPWFSPLSSSEEFPRHVEGILEDTLLELSHKLAFIHPSKAVEVCVETMCCHIQQLPRCQQSSESLGADHPAAVDRRSEWLYLESLATVALRLVEPGDILTAKAVHLLVVHIICRDILLPLVDLISKPGVMYFIIVTMCERVSTKETIDEVKQTLSSTEAVEIREASTEEPSVNDVLDIIIPTSANRHSISLPPAAHNPSRLSPYRARASVDIERAVEADQFVDGAALQKVCISKTESRNEHGKGVYTVYCIEYQPQIGGPLYRTKRRFNEFINLQTSLSKLGRFELPLRSVKGPSRWQANPFQNDKKNVTNRKIYLQNYLSQLSSIPEVVRTVQFQLFMGMIGDPDNYFTGGVAATGSSLRIDRMLAEGVRGALDLIKTALPGDTSPSREAVNGDSAALQGGHRVSHEQPPNVPPPMRSCVEVKYDNDASGRRLRQAVLNYIDSFDLASSPEFSPVHCGGASPMTPIPRVPSSKSELEEGKYYSDAFISPNPPGGVPPILSPRGMQQFSNELQLRLSLNQDSNTASSVSGAESLAGPSMTPPAASPPKDPLIRALIDLLIVILEGAGYGASKIPALLVKLEGLAGSSAEEWLSDSFEETFSPHKCAILLHKLHVLISSLASGGDISANERTQEEARQALRTLMPPWTLAYVPLIDQVIDAVLDTFSQERFNRALVYKLADALLDLLASVDSIEEWTTAHK